MTELGVTLTDYGLVCECVVFSCLLAPFRKTASSIPIWFMVFFSSIAVAALTGGTVHGFFPDISSVGYRILWPATLIAIGVTALAGIRIGIALQFADPVAGLIALAAYVAFVLYGIVVLFISSEFVVAILGYLPMVCFLGWAFFAAYRRHRRQAYLIGFLGVCTTLVAAVVQQAKHGIDPRYFNHNVVYHVLQAAGLFMVFIAARDISKHHGV